MTNPAPVTAAWLSTEQVMERLGVSRRTVERARTSGRLRGHTAPGGRVLRFRLEDVDALLSPDPTPAGD